MPAIFGYLYLEKKLWHDCCPSSFARLYWYGSLVSSLTLLSKLRSTEQVSSMQKLDSTGQSCSATILARTFWTYWRGAMLWTSWQRLRRTTPKQSRMLGMQAEDQVRCLMASLKHSPFSWDIVPQSCAIKNLHNAWKLWHHEWKLCIRLILRAKYC